MFPVTVVPIVSWKNVMYVIINISKLLKPLGYYFSTRSQWPKIFVFWEERFTRNAMRSWNQYFNLFASILFILKAEFYILNYVSPSVKLVWSTPSGFEESEKHPNKIMWLWSRPILMKSPPNCVWVKIAHSVWVSVSSSGYKRLLLRFWVLS